MKNKRRRALTMGWNGITAIALLCLSVLGGQRAAFAADPAVTASTVEVVPYQASGYRYSVIDYATQTTRPNVGFEQPEFDDSGWGAGQASMGSGGGCPLQATKHVTWPVATEIYVRRKVIIPEGATNIRIMAAADNDILAFFDGIPLGGTITHEDCPVLDEFRLDVEPFAGEVEAGEHVLAFYIKDRGIESFFDMRLLVDVDPATPIVKFTGELIRNNSALRACAGGVDDHTSVDYQYRAHTRLITATLTSQNQPVADAHIELNFKDNKGHDYGNSQPPLRARLHLKDEPFDATHPWSESLTTTTNNQGQVSFWVKSGDVICAPTLHVSLIKSPTQKVKAGTLNCEFASAVSKRRFNDLAGYDSGDEGWLFYFPNLNNPNEITGSYLADPGNKMPAKIYMKFLVDDEDADGHWQYVNGHTIEMEITGVEKEVTEPADADGITEPEDPSPIASAKRFVAFDNGTMKSSVVTRGDGSGQSMTVAGDSIQNITRFFVEATDNSVWENE